jgi:PAS domain S-box-containing protein
MKDGSNTDAMDAPSANDALPRELEACHRRILELARTESLLAGENRLLEMVAKSQPLPAILDGICRLVEDVTSGSLCSILLLEGDRLWHGAAPSLPATYINAFGGRPIGSNAGPCGRACFYGRPVTVSDIAADPIGDDYRDLALAHGLRACWSTPIFSSDGQVLGSFAVLSREARSPTPQHQEIIAQVTHLAAVAIERRRTETALRDSEERFRRMAESIPEVIWFTALHPERVLYVSPSFERVWGFRVQDSYVNPRLWVESIHAEDRGKVADKFSRWIAGQAVNYQDIEYRILKPDGGVRWIHERGVLTFDALGKPCLASRISTDITERKKSEEAVRAAKARFEGILEIADDAIISVDAAQRIVLFNQGAEKMFGYAPGEVNGKPLDVLLPRRFAHAHHGHIEAFAKSSEVSRTMAQRREVFGRRKDGGEFPAEASISKLNLGGELVFTVILRDITERKVAAEALRASEHLARGQLEALARSLAALSRESVPEKFLEHVLRIAGEQLGAVGVSVWEMNNQDGYVDLAATFQDGALHLPAKNDDPTPPRLARGNSTHPVWTEFFRTGKHCVFGRIQNGPPWSEVAIHPDGPWHDWRAGTVDHPVVPQMIKDLAASGIVATLNVPMLVADRVAGLFVLCFNQRRAYRPDEIELTRAMANQAMLAIQLMRLSQANRESAVLAERNRLARDLHDTLAQGFTGVIMQLEATKGAMVNADAPSALAHIERAERLARASLGEARRSVRAMRSRSLVDGTLSTALDELLKRMTSGTELQAELSVQGEGRPLPPDWEEGLLRIAQESLTNTIKYAQAHRFRATLNFMTNAVRLQLVDDGQGFDARTEHEGFGLIGMRERAGQLAGNFVLRSTPGQGTEIVVELNQSRDTNGHHEVGQA